MTRWSYSCPWCDAMLNPDETIILTAAQGENRVLIGFHPEPGNYELYLPPDVSLEEGAHWDFFCPVCRENLMTGELENLCELRIREGAERRRIFFSNIAGEHATIIMADNTVERGHGEHAERYVPKLVGIRY